MNFAMKKIAKIDLLKELRFARKTIRKMKRETNEFEEGRAIANRALPRLDAVIRVASQRKS